VTPNHLRNCFKPIRLALELNDVPISWKSLSRLEKSAVIEGWRDGPASYYRRLDAPKEFEAVNYLAGLDSRLTPEMAYEFEVGGWFSQIGFGRIMSILPYI